MTDKRIISVSPPRCYAKKDLLFGFGNAKLSKSVGTFSLPAGWTCPFAKECLTKCHRITGKLTAGKDCRFRCFSASQENSYPNVRAARWHNLDILKGCKSLQALGTMIQNALPDGIQSVRVHVAGDFYNERYFLAWLNVAKNNPHSLFYGYTKAIPFLVDWRKFIPANFRFVASRGSTHDALIGQYHLKSAEVVYSPEEAAERGLEIDHNDNLAMSLDNKSFALLIHGTQPPGTEASKAWVALRKRGIGGYGTSSISRNLKSPEKHLRVFVTIKNGKPFVPQTEKVNA